MDELVRWLTVLVAVGSGVVGGVMLAFSTSVMPGLRRRPPAEAMAAMRAFNTAILNPVFGLAFGGTLVASVALAVTAPFAGVPHAGWRVAGALAYAGGGFLLTMLVNVPLNNRLEAAGPAGPGAAQLWAEFLRRWTAWNHVRTVACVAAALVLTAVATTGS
ncbi:MAG TPA: anthrone oxygenase family protein [Pseudonocardiaceae bacterium]